MLFGPVVRNSLIVDGSLRANLLNEEKLFVKQQMKRSETKIPTDCKKKTLKGLRVPLNSLVKVHLYTGI